MIGNPSPSTDQMRAFANVTGTNFLNARTKLTEDPEIEVFSGAATKIVKLQTRLLGLNADFRIDPQFNWTEEDMQGYIDAT
jgi:hypothetical protein